MAVIVGQWAFDSGSVPSLKDIADHLRSTTQLEVREENAELGQALVFPKFKYELFRWEFRPGMITVQSLGCPHPYVWENLDQVMIKKGGIVSDAVYCWRPQREHAALRQPWMSLAWCERAILRCPIIGVDRPFDGLLSSAQRCQAGRRKP